MFRSLFIGFLILSALTSKGAGVQINQNLTNIPADMLLELYNEASDKLYLPPASLKRAEERKFFYSRKIFFELMRYNAAVAYADKQAEIATARPEGVFFTNSSANGGAVEELLRPLRHDNPVAWMPADYNSSLIQAHYFRNSSQQTKLHSGAIDSSGTDISPPCCMGNN